MSLRDVTQAATAGAGSAPGRRAAGPQRLPRLGYLGPARVLEHTGRRLRLRLDDRSAPVDAALALALPYQVQRDDRLLVVGDSGGYWAVGVLHGRGAIELSTPAGRRGGVSLHTLSGRLRLSADRAIRMGGRRQVRMLATERLTITATEIQRRAGDWVQRARERLELLTTDRDEIVDRSWAASARRLALEVKTVFRLNSRSVRLG